MAWQKTNKWRRAILTVAVNVDGLNPSEKTYDIRNSFSISAGGGLNIAFSSITTEQLSQLTENVYQSRLSSFLTYITSVIKSEFPSLEGNIEFTNQAFGSDNIIDPPTPITSPSEP